MSAGGGAQSAEQAAGLETHYRVEKINDLAGKHDDCRYFVLDPQHDPLARYALAEYASRARAAGLEVLADDLHAWLSDVALDVLRERLSTPIAVAATTDLLWIKTTPEFGSAHPHGACHAFVNGTICGFPRRADGTCGDGHPAQPDSAPVHSISDLRAAARVMLTSPGQRTDGAPS